jgi:phytoene dehydrogenase-like protein
MESSGNDDGWDAIIIGCGMAGLAAGIRIALDGKRVLILERHNVAGGLNSFYFQAGRKFDVGLHAVTNYLDPGEKGPLSKIFRQLRLSREAVELFPQVGSRIAFPGGDLHFTNDFNVLEASVADHFPGEVQGFRRLREGVLGYDALDLSAPPLSTRTILRQHLHDPVLQDMLMCPLMYYGSATEADMDFSQFATLWRAIFEEGFGRPAEGVRVIIRALLEKFRSLGGERRMKAAVRRLIVEEQTIRGVELASGECLFGRKIISTIGGPETMGLCDGWPEPGPRVGRLSFAETISVLDRTPMELGIPDTIVFFNDADRFSYEQAAGPVDLRSGVICCPNNYQYPPEAALNEGWLRVTALASHAYWTALPEEAYRAEKSNWFGRIVASAARFLPQADSESIRHHTVHEDMFTPRTIERFTGHFGGAVYGSPNKFRKGETPYENLFLAGTDQGFLGIVGAMLSGISIANLHVVGR